MLSAAYLCDHWLCNVAAAALQLIAFDSEERTGTERGR